MSSCNHPIFQSDVTGKTKDLSIEVRLQRPHSVFHRTESLFIVLKTFKDDSNIFAATGFNYKTNKAMTGHLVLVLGFSMTGSG